MRGSHLQQRRLGFTSAEELGGHEGAFTQNWHQTGTSVTAYCPAA